MAEDRSDIAERIISVRKLLQHRRTGIAQYRTSKEWPALPAQWLFRNARLYDLITLFDHSISIFGALFGYLSQACCVMHLQGW